MRIPLTPHPSIRPTPSHTHTMSFVYAARLGSSRLRVIGLGSCGDGDLEPVGEEGEEKVTVAPVPVASAVPSRFGHHQTRLSVPLALASPINEEPKEDVERECPACKPDCVRTALHPTHTHTSAHPPCFPPRPPLRFQRAWLSSLTCLPLPPPSPYLSAGTTRSDLPSTRGPSAFSTVPFQGTPYVPSGSRAEEPLPLASASQVCIRAQLSAMEPEDSEDCVFPTSSVVSVGGEACT
jgi:hypothetical protein